MRLSFGLALILCALTGTAHAQTSQKPIQIIVPFAPGGSADGIGRIIATELGTKLGGHDPGDAVGGRARRERHDDLDRFLCVLGQYR